MNLNIKDIQNAKHISTNEIYLHDLTFDAWKRNNNMPISFSVQKGEEFNILDRHHEEDHKFKFLITSTDEYQMDMEPLITEWALSNGYAKKHDYYIREIYNHVQNPWKVEGGFVFEDHTGIYLSCDSYELAEKKSDRDFGPITLSESNRIQVTKKLTETLDRCYYHPLEARGLLAELFIIKETEFHGRTSNYFGEHQGFLLPEYKHLLNSTY